MSKPKDMTPEEEIAYRERRRVTMLKYRQTHRELLRPIQRRADLKRKYNITESEFWAMMIAQDFKCAICSAELEDPVIDHDHITGVVRGILCRTCNLGIGHLKDSLELVREAVRYLERS